MKAPLGWLNDFVDIDVSPKEYSDALTMSGSKVEGFEILGEEITKVVVGKILTREKHPDADKLQVTRVDVGNGEIQIVTGATNIEVGDLIPIALHGSTLPGGKKITKGKLRGVESHGMMCSIQELELSKEDYPEAAEDGIFILQQGLIPGTDIKEVLGMKETVIEFEITPNRADCLSIVGLARETAATFGKEFKKPGIKVMEEAGPVEEEAAVEIIDADLCPRYAARVLEDVKIAPSPKWMRDRLKAAGVRPINNIVDITNYVMLEMGQPMHAFDLENLEGRKITVRRAKSGEVLETLDGQNRELDPSMLVIADAARPVAVAGVMGGANTEVTENTKTILFESATFDGTTVRLTAKKLGMRTEASGRFEKGLDVENVGRALERAVQLAEELGAGRVCKGVLDCYPVKPEKRIISLRPDKINTFLGTEIGADEMVRILEALEIKVDTNTMTVEVPSFRPDLEQEADIAEEVARFYGYNNIKATLLEGKAAAQGKKTRTQKIVDIISDTMVSCGFMEAYTYSFTSPKVFDALRLPKDSGLRNALVISNPLGEDFSIMRTTTIPEMLEILSLNYNRRIESARIYEIARVYIPKGEGLADERATLTVGMYGGCDFYDLKGAVEELLNRLGIKKYDFEPVKDDSIYHPGRAAALYINGVKAGMLGEIHPETAENFEAPERAYAGTFDIMTLADNTDLTSQYRALPKYPAINRDIAMLVKEDILVREIENIIRKKAGKFLEDIMLFDVYKGKQVPEGMKSVAYSITFRAEDRTLKDEEVNKAMSNILEELKGSLEAQLRE